MSALTLRLNIPDDLGRPRPEGAQTFDLLLLLPVNGILGEPAKATISVRCESTTLSRRLILRGPPELRLDPVVDF